MTVTSGMCVTLDKWETTWFIHQTQWLFNVPFTLQQNKPQVPLSEMHVLISKYVLVGVPNQYIHNTCSTDTPKLDMMDVYKNSKSLHYTLSSIQRILSLLFKSFCKLVKCQGI